jgi:hypothetical protein
MYTPILADVIQIPVLVMEAPFFNIIAGGLVLFFAFKIILKITPFIG